MINLLLPDEERHSADDADERQDTLEGPELAFLDPRHSVTAEKDSRKSGEQNLDVHYGLEQVWRNLILILKHLGLKLVSFTY